MRRIRRYKIKFSDIETAAKKRDMPVDEAEVDGIGAVLAECLYVLAVLLGVYGILLALESVMPEFTLQHSVVLFGIALAALPTCFVPYILIRKRRFRLICIGLTVLLWLVIWTVGFFKPVMEGMKLLLSAISVLAEQYYERKFFFIALEGCEGWSGQMMCTAFAITVAVPFLLLFGYCMFRKRIIWPVLAFDSFIIMGCLLLGYCPSLASVYLMVVHLVIAVIAKTLRNSDRRRGLLLACASLAAAMLMSSLVIKPVFYSYVDLNKMQQQAYRLTHSGAGIELARDIAYDLTGIFRNTSYGGISGGVIGATNRLEYRDRVDLTVTVQDDVKNPVYIKAFVGGEYTGHGWNSDSIALPDTLDEVAVMDASYQYLKRLNNDSIMTNRIVTMTIEVNGGNASYVYYPYLSHVTEEDGLPVADMYIKRNGQSSDVFAYVDVNTNQALGQYRYMTTFAEYYPYSDFRKIDSTYISFIKMNYLGVTEECSAALLNEVNEGFHTAYGWNNDTVEIENKVAFVRDYLAEKAEYSLEPGKTPRDSDFVVYFLTEQKAGYCTHFASAGVILFRLMGVPARYVEGYRVPGGLEAGKATEVLDTCAHAWVEIYLEGYGWIPIDVTPGYSDSETVTLYPAQEETESVEPASETEPSEEQPESSVPEQGSTEAVNPSEQASVPEQEQTSGETAPASADANTEQERDSDAYQAGNDMPENGNGGAGNDGAGNDGAGNDGVGNDGAGTGVGADTHFQLEALAQYMLPLLLSLLTAAALLLIVQLRRISLLQVRRHRFTCVNRNKAILAIYSEQICMISRSGVGPAVTEESRNACQSCEIYHGLCGVEAEEWRELLETVKEARFSDHVVSEEQWRKASAIYIRFVKGLPKEMNWGQRFVFRYFWGYD